MFLLQRSKSVYVSQFLYLKHRVITSQKFPSVVTALNVCFSSWWLPYFLPWRNYLINVCWVNFRWEKESNSRFFFIFFLISEERIEMGQKWNSLVISNFIATPLLVECSVLCHWHCYKPSFIRAQFCSKRTCYLNENKARFD